MADLTDLEQTLRGVCENEDEIAAVLDAQRPEPFAVLPENHTAVRAFLSASTQWRIAPSGLLYGLDYASAQVVWRANRFKLTADDFNRLQIMEREAILAMQ